MGVYPVPVPGPARGTSVDMTHGSCVIRDAKFDPRFDTFWKRLVWFKCPEETFKKFALRCGVNPSTLRRWKAGDMPHHMETAMRVAGNLDVCVAWLTYGNGHYSGIFMKGMVRLTVFPRFNAHYQFTDRPGEDELRAFTSFYH